jgi:Calcineurin-like phosphoesterase superfamily domain
MNSRLTITLPDDCEAIALAGGPYSNFAAVAAFLRATEQLEHRFCLGDIGGFGPLPDRTIELIRGAGLACVQGNYDHAIGYGEDDCGCGYIDPMDRHYAQVSYDYTDQKTSAEHKAWLRQLPEQIVLRWRGQTLLLCHGSPDQVNEFVWESETTDATIAGWLQKQSVSGICATHSGLPWIRNVANGGGFWFNAGVLGRPAHEDSTRVFYGIVDFPRGASVPVPRLVELAYDPAPVAEAMRTEGLPDVFVESLLGGRWTTCCNILPAAERIPRDRLAALRQTDFHGLPEQENDECLPPYPDPVHGALN